MKSWPPLNQIQTTGGRMEAILGKWKEEAYVLMRIMMGFMILREIVHESGLMEKLRANHETQTLFQT